MSSMTKAQTERFVQAALLQPQGKLFIICLYAGLRKGEGLALTGNDIDLKKSVIHVTKGYTSKGGISTPKTAKGVRDVPIFDTLKPYLTGLDLKGKERLFLLSETGATKAFNRTAEVAHLPSGAFSCHCLRHTFATRCAELEMPPKVVQQWLGHASLDMTLNVYTHVQADFEKECIKKFNKGVKLY